jgi:hypothetical protein
MWLIQAASQAGGFRFTRCRFVVFLSPSKAKRQMARPRKITLPTTLDVWLRLALQNKRLEDRWKIFREWRRNYLATTLGRAPTDQELEIEIQKWKQFEFYISLQETVWMDNLRVDFLPKFHKENLRKRAQAMASGTWSKENREKRVKKKQKTS